MAARVRPRARDRLAQLVELATAWSRSRASYGADAYLIDNEAPGPRGVARGRARRRHHAPAPARPRSSSSGSSSSSARAAPTDVAEFEVVQRGRALHAAQDDPPGAWPRGALSARAALRAHARRLRPASRRRAAGVRRPARAARARRAAARALDGVDRLVLLGDMLELRHGPAREALAARRAGPARRSARRWARRRGRDRRRQPRPRARRALARAGRAPRRRAAAARARGARRPAAAASSLARVASALAPARVAVAYPGVWLRDDVYATHGHYLDVHIDRADASSAWPPGVDGAAWPAPVPDARRAARRGLRGGARARSTRGSTRRAQTTPPRPAAGRQRRLDARVAGARRAPAAPQPLRCARCAPAFAAAIAGAQPRRPRPAAARHLTGPALRRAGLRGARRGRASGSASTPRTSSSATPTAPGPLPDDAPGEWRTPVGHAAVNTGSLGLRAALHARGAAPARARTGRAAPSRVERRRRRRGSCGCSTTLTRPT